MSRHESTLTHGNSGTAFHPRPRRNSRLTLFDYISGGTGLYLKRTRTCAR